MYNSQPSSNMKFNSILNFRDIGGISSAENRKIRSGIIFRSANPDNITKEDLKLLHSLNIKTIIDLRGPLEQKKRKQSLNHIDILSLPLDFQQITEERLKPYLGKKGSEKEISDISNGLYLDILDATQVIFSRVLETLLSNDRSPVLIHCQAGKDRTGIITALILLTLGTERQLIINDFMRSNDELMPFFKKTLLKRKILSLGFFPSDAILFAVTLRKRNIESVIDRITDHYGGIEGFIKDSGFDMSRMAELKEKLYVN